MGVFRHPIEIGSPDGSRFEPFDARVDTGATFTMAPASALRRLGVRPRSVARFRLANDAVIEREVGETEIRIDGEQLSTKVVFGDEADPVILGAYTLEGALLAVEPVRRRLVPTEGLLMACATHHRTLKPGRAVTQESQQ